MAVTQITSDLAGIHGNISDVSVTMAVPSLNPTELGGGTGSIRFGLAPMARPQTLRNQPVVLSEKGAWSVAGRISNVEWGGLGGVTLDAETSMQRLNVTVALAPSYTLSEAAAMDLALAKAGFTSSGLASPHPARSWGPSSGPQIGIAWPWNEYMEALGDVGRRGLPLLVRMCPA